MRPGQHNKRGRGRNRRHSGGGGGGGGGGNPLNRVYESNGPDVKVRGTAMTVADKYLQLGRDAQASGDNVMAESYYQHAEHYLRIVAAAQAYNQQMQQQFRRPEDDFGDEEDGEGGEGDDVPAEGAERGFAAEASEQPPMEGFEQPASQERRDFQNRDNREGQQFGRNRDRNRSRWDNRRDREGQDQQPRSASQSRGEEPPAPAQAQPQPPAEQPREQVNGSASGEGWGEGPQPSFLKRPGRRGRPKREAVEGEAAAGDTAAES